MQKKHERGWGRRRLRYPASEKFEIIRLVEQSHLSVRRILAKVGVPPTTFYRWYDRFVEHRPDGLDDHPSKPCRVWNRIPDAVRDQIVDLALEEPELSPRELAVTFTDREKYFVSEASIYRLLKSLDLITSPACIVIKAADEFKDQGTDCGMTCTERGVGRAIREAFRWEYPRRSVAFARPRQAALRRPEGRQRQVAALASGQDGSLQIGCQKRQTHDLSLAGCDRCRLETRQAG